MLGLGFSTRLLQRSFLNERKKALRFMNVCNSPRMLIKPSERFDMFIDVGQMPLMILMSMSNDVFPRVNEVKYKIVR